MQGRQGFVSLHPDCKKKMGDETTRRTPNGAEKKTQGSGTMYRVTYNTHLSLTKMADHKAHLMIGINTFLLSFVISKRKMGVLAHIPNLVVPDILLVFFCVACIVLATLVVRPAVIPKKPKAAGQKINWLYFGDFSRYSVDEFDRNVMSLIRDNEAMEEALSRDLYYLGLSLARKYRYLSWCYQVFYVGLLAVSAAFIGFGLMSH